MILFGSGQYVHTGDPADLSVQTVYGVWDKARLQKIGDSYSWSEGASLAHGDLLEQTFLYEDVIGERKWRVVSNDTLDWEAKRGWFVDLVSPVDGEQGERIMYQPAVIPGSGEVMFTSIVPTEADDPCMAGTAYRWIFVLDLYSGGISDWTRFDTNEDGVFDQDDVKRIQEEGEIELVPYTGFTTDIGGAATPAGQGLDVVILAERLIPGGPPRQSWRQLR
jgi:type IV pilus assembly protein PilY1